MNWFGTAIWKADGHTYVHYGRPLSDSDEVAIWREGVGMREQLGHGSWLERYGRLFIISAGLKVVRAGQRRPGGSRESVNAYTSAISA